MSSWCVLGLAFAMEELATYGAMSKMRAMVPSQPTTCGYYEMAIGGDYDDHVWAREKHDKWAAS